jgi:hypothetical protein
MAGPDGTASAALGAAILHPCYVGWLDFDGDPLRVTTAPYDVTFSGTGDVDLDGFTFEAANPDLIAVSDVRHREEGSDTLTATLSGLVGLDTDLINIIDDRSKWYRRDAALWLMLYDADLQRIGNVWRYYTGQMINVQHKGSAGEQVIEVSIENYLATYSEASGRTYLDQQLFDAGDLSAEAAIAIANGRGGAGLAGGGGAGGGGGGIGSVGGAGPGFREV